jgi:hypothetical protein
MGIPKKVKILRIFHCNYFIVKSLETINFSRKKSKKKLEKTAEKRPNKSFLKIKKLGLFSLSLNKIEGNEGENEGNGLKKLIYLL